MTSQLACCVLCLLLHPRQRLMRRRKMRKRTRRTDSDSMPACSSRTVSTFHEPVVSTKLTTPEADRGITAPSNSALATRSCAATLLFRCLCYIRSVTFVSFPLGSMASVTLGRSTAIDEEKKHKHKESQCDEEARWGHVQPRNTNRTHRIACPSSRQRLGS